MNFDFFSQLNWDLKQHQLPAGRLSFCHHPWVPQLYFILAPVPSAVRDTTRYITRLPPYHEDQLPSPRLCHVLWQTQRNKWTLSKFTQWNFKLYWEGRSYDVNHRLSSKLYTRFATVYRFIMNLRSCEVLQRVWLPVVTFFFPNKKCSRSLTDKIFSTNRKTARNFGKNRTKNPQTPAPPLRLKTYHSTADFGGIGALS